MAFVWRLQWWALPVIVEEHLMGDTPSNDERQYQGRVIGGATLGRPGNNSSLQIGLSTVETFRSTVWLTKITTH